MNHSTEGRVRVQRARHGFSAALHLLAVVAPSLAAVVVGACAGDGELCTSPAIAGGGGQVFVGSTSGKVYEVDEKTGAQRSVYNTGAAVSPSSESMSMAVASGHLLVPAGNALIVF